MATQTYLYQGEYARSLMAKGQAEGEARGEAKGVLLVLEARGFRVTEDERERIMSCTDTRTLERWLQRAALVDSVGKLFE